MNDKKQYKIESFQDILQNIKMSFFKEFMQFWNIAVKSSKKSNKIFLLQCINLVSVWLLIFLVLPNYINQITVGFMNIEYVFLPIGKMALAFVSWIAGITVPGLFGFSWTTIFETGLKITLFIMFILVVITIISFWELMVNFKNRLIYVLLIWKINK